MSLSILGILILVTLASCNITGTTPQDPMGRIWNEVSVKDDWFSKRSSHAAVVFDNKLWVIGGYEGKPANGARLNDVWFSSDDGASWTEVTDGVTTPRFSKRSNHATAVFEGKLWVIGGYDGKSYYNDVWSSSDGKSWTEEIEEIKETEETEGATPPRFSKRSNYAAAVFEGKLWVIGGYDGKSYFNDVWSSSDGKSWTEVVTNDADAARFSGRSDHATVVFDGKLWVIGGFGGSRLNDVWSSSDGKSWTEVVTNDAARFSIRYKHTAVVLDGKIWVIGGYDGTLRSDDVWPLRSNDVWSSPDGKSWTEVTKGVTSARFPGRDDHAAVVFNGKLWVIGGLDSKYVYKNDVWYSP